MAAINHLMRFIRFDVLWILFALIAGIESFAIVPTSFGIGTSSSTRTASSAARAFTSVSTKVNLSFRVDFDDKDGLTFDPDGPRITFQGRTRSQHCFEQESVEIQQASRTLLHYLALPAEEYSVLDAGTISKRTDGESNQFTCTLDPITFLGNTIIAQIDAEVDVSPYPEGQSVIRVTGCTLDGSRLAKFANGSFDVSCTNIVRATRSDTRTAKDVPMLSVECQLEVSALVPREGRWLPKRLVSKSGSIVMQQMLNILVPRFVKQLAKDYEVWSAGDDSRAPVGSVSEDEAVDDVANGMLKGVSQLEESIVVNGNAKTLNATGVVV